MSALVVDSWASQTLISMSKFDRTSLLITNPLDENSFENSGSTIHVSFTSPEVPNTYLRHENGRIRLGRNDQSTLFKQDATFKLLISELNSNIVAFQPVNIAGSYVAIDNETQTILILSQPERQMSNICSLEKRFLFELILNA